MISIVIYEEPGLIVLRLQIHSLACFAAIFSKTASKALFPHEAILGTITGIEPMSYLHTHPLHSHLWHRPMRRW